MTHIRGETIGNNIETIFQDLLLPQKIRDQSISKKNGKKNRLRKPTNETFAKLFLYS